MRGVLASLIFHVSEGPGGCGVHGVLPRGGPHLDVLELPRGLPRGGPHLDVLVLRRVGPRLDVLGPAGWRAGWWAGWRGRLARPAGWLLGWMAGRLAGRLVRHPARWQAGRRNSTARGPRLMTLPGWRRALRSALRRRPSSPPSRSLPDRFPRQPGYQATGEPSPNSARLFPTARSASNELKTAAQGSRPFRTSSLHTLSLSLSLLSIYLSIYLCMQCVSCAMSPPSLSISHYQYEICT